jgi:glycosyltransferase involved in cell wall biosynthesis
VVVQTESVAAWARSFLPDRKVRVVPNFVRDLPPPVKIRDAKLVLAVGRLERQKGFDLLLDAFAASGVAGRGFRLVILGEGIERRPLMARVSELGIESQVSMPGVVRDPESWMARAAIFALTSRYEGFPNALLEAMAMGCAVVAADCDSGPRDIVRDEVDGLLVPPENVPALAAQLLRLANDAVLRASLGSAAIAVRDRFSRPSVLRKWEKLIGEVCAR